MPRFVVAWSVVLVERLLYPQEAYPEAFALALELRFPRHRLVQMIWSVGAVFRTYSMGKLAQAEKMPLRIGFALAHPGRYSGFDSYRPRVKALPAPSLPYDLSVFDADDAVTLPVDDSTLLTQYDSPWTSGAAQTYSWPLTLACLSWVVPFEKVFARTMILFQVWQCGFSPCGEHALGTRFERGLPHSILGGHCDSHRTCACFSFPRRKH